MARSFELLSDLHKDARGYRPSIAFMEAFDEKPESEQQRIWDDLCAELERRELEDARQELIAQREFEGRIEGMVADYGIARADAFRWDMEGFDVDLDAALSQHGSADQEIEFYLYKQGLGFSVFPMYVAEIKAGL